MLEERRACVRAASLAYAHYPALLACTDANPAHQVKEDRAKDRVLSMLEEERQRKVDAQRRGLALAPLFAKPRPVWQTPALIATFGDAFMCGHHRSPPPPTLRHHVPAKRPKSAPEKCTGLTRRPLNMGHGTATAR
jgi:hypothetical protein